MAEKLARRALIAAIQGAPPPDIDWTLLISEANRTLTTGTMAERLLQGGHPLPDDVRAFLKVILDRSVERNQRLRHQLSETLACLNEAAIRPILMKGMAALLTISGDRLRGRILSDLDLMVSASDFARSVDCLRAIGYAPDPGSGDGRTSAVVFRTRDVGMLDIHCRMKGPGLQPDYARLAPECTEVTVGEGIALLPSATAQFWMLVRHDQIQDRDYWRGLIDLRHLIDMDMLARTPQGIDWQKLASWFPPGFARSALRTQLLAAQDLLGVAIPPVWLGDRWPRFQHRRRMLQARWPFLMAPLTLLTLICDPPTRGPSEDEEPAHPAAAPPGRLALARAGLRRFGRPRAAGKL